MQIVFFPPSPFSVSSFSPSSSLHYYCYHWYYYCYFISEILHQYLFTVLGWSQWVDWRIRIWREWRKSQCPFWNPWNQLWRGTWPRYSQGKSRHIGTCFFPKVTIVLFDYSPCHKIIVCIKACIVVWKRMGWGELGI